MTKERELLEAFAKHVNKESCIEDDYVSMPVETFIDSFLATRPEEKEEKRKICPKAAQCAQVTGGLTCPKDVICPI
jgi:hypothetical protein